jgi:signal transduction histidine kinase
MAGDDGLETLDTEIVDSVRMPLLLLDARQRVVRTNRAFDNTFQLESPQAAGRPLAELADGQWRDDALSAALERVIVDGAPFDDLVLARDFPSLGPRFLLLNGRRLRRAANSELLVLLAVEDITERRRIEERVRRQSEELQRSNQDLEQFAYVASHDLQEPLRMVVSYTQLLSNRYKGKLDSDAEDFIAYAVDGAKRMQRLISDLLAYSRVDRRGGELSAVSASEALTDALEALTAARADTGATIDAGELPPVLADYGQLVQLFQNLLGNALKFRSPGPVVIRVSAERDGAFWRFRVEDNGIGISPQYFEKVFIIFERLHGTEVPGTGIGLALCRKIVQRHGGRIWIEPAAQIGTVFYFTLPAAGGNTP